MHDIPDRNPDHVRTLRPMADEIIGSNTIYVECIRGLWHARIGPDVESGITALGSCPETAISRLAENCRRLGWVFDPSWRAAP